MRRLFCLLVLTGSAHAAASDADTMALIDANAAFDPEAASQVGVEKWDTKAIDLGPGFAERHRKVLEQMVSKLEARRAAEKDAAVVSDLEILIHWAKVRIRSIELEEKHLVPYFALERLLFGGLRPVLDDQIDAARRQKMVT